MITILGVAIATSVLFSSCSPTNQEKAFQAPLFDNMGDYWMETTSSSEDAKRFFIQGMLMSYGFNHAEAIRSFKEAVRLDSSFAMAYWGLAYALGPNYNAGMDPNDHKKVRWAIDKAVSYSGSSNLQDWEIALIKSADIKYPENTTEPDNEGYASFLKEVSKQFPSNADILTFSAEAQMNLHPWDLYDYKGGPAKAWTPGIVSLLQKAVAMDSNHPLANHLLIHATEASSTPEDGLDAADKLTSIVPGSGHLVHMPSHTYINTGDYHMGSVVNEQAVLVDSTYVAQCRAKGVYPQLYYPHNYHFLAACAALEGRGALSLEAAFKMADIIDRNYLGKPGYETTQHFLTIPYNVLVKFSQWEKILALPKPDEQYPYLTAVWKYSRGMAFANTGKLEMAEQELSDLIAIQSTEELASIGIFDINTAQDVADIAVAVLSAEIADKNGDDVGAEKRLLKAIAIEDKLSYNEPPDWFFSVRHALGDLYIRMGKYEQAEKVYRRDLENFPKNGFALNGLFHSLRMQGRKQEAASVKGAFTDAWKYADSSLAYSRIDEAAREDLAIKIKTDSPKELIYLASTFCGFN